MNGTKTLRIQVKFQGMPVLIFMYIDIENFGIYANSYGRSKCIQSQLIVNYISESIAKYPDYKTMTMEMKAILDRRND